MYSIHNRNYLEKLKNLQETTRQFSLESVVISSKLSKINSITSPQEVLNTSTTDFP